MSISGSGADSESSLAMSSSVARKHGELLGNSELDKSANDVNTREAQPTSSDDACETAGAISLLTREGVTVHGASPEHNDDDDVVEANSS